MKLFNSKSLAAELGFGKSTWIVKAVKLAGSQSGDSPFVGRYCTVEKFHAWLDRHPEFVASRVLRKIEV